METEAADFSVDITTGPHVVIAPAGDLDLAAAGIYTWTSDRHTQYGTRVIPTTV
jgi:hypothetical protein